MQSNRRGPHPHLKEAGPHLPCSFPPLPPHRQRAGKGTTGTSGIAPHVSDRDVHDVLGQILIGGGEAGPQAGRRATAAAQGGSAACSEQAEAVRQHEHRGFRAATVS